MAEDKPEDDVKDVHDEPDKDESVDETLERHEALHHEHRRRIDRIHEHLGLEDEDEGEGEPEDDIRRRRRHD